MNLKEVYKNYLNPEMENAIKIENTKFEDLDFKIFNTLLTTPFVNGFRQDIFRVQNHIQVGDKSVVKDRANTLIKRLNNILEFIDNYKIVDNINIEPTDKEKYTVWMIYILINTIENHNDDIKDLEKIFELYNTKKYINTIKNKYKDLYDPELFDLLTKFSFFNEASIQCAYYSNFDSIRKFIFNKKYFRCVYTDICYNYDYNFVNNFGDINDYINKISDIFVKILTDSLNIFINEHNNFINNSKRNSIIRIGEIYLNIDKYCTLLTIFNELDMKIELHKKFNEVLVAIMEYFRKNKKYCKSYLNKSIRNGLKYYIHLTGTNIDRKIYKYYGRYYEYTFIINYLKDQLDKGVDIHEEYGITQNNVTSLLTMNL